MGAPQHPVQVQYRRLFGEPTLPPRAILNISVVAQEDCRNSFAQYQAAAYRLPHRQTITKTSFAISSASLQTKILLSMIRLRISLNEPPGKAALLSFRPSRFGRSLSLTFPFNRQQLADFLCVERAAMSGLSCQSCKKERHDHESKSLFERTADPLTLPLLLWNCNHSYKNTPVPPRRNRMTRINLPYYNHFCCQKTDIGFFRLVVKSAILNRVQ